MPKMMLHQDEARLALSRGVAKLTRAVEGTLGPRGMNAIIDVPIGTPIVSRDGVSIANEIELECRFENVGAQVVREVSKQTNEVAGDGTTTATVLANALVQEGLELLGSGANAVEIVHGIEAGVEVVTEALKEIAKPLASDDALKAVATIAANDTALGELVAQAITQVGPEGTVTVEHGLTVETTLEVAEGMTFDRGYISHHMVTDVEKMQAVLEEPCILMTDHKISAPEEIAELLEATAKIGRPLLVIAEEVSPEVIVSMLAKKNGTLQVAAIHPPEYGHWRKAMLEDLAILTGGRVIARELGGKVAEAKLADLGTAKRVRIGSKETTITGGGGDPKAIAARRTQVARQIDAAPQNIEQDKLTERLAKLSGGSAVVLAGGATPVEQRRRGQLIEDALNAARAAAAEGVVPGGGTAMVQAAAALDSLLDSLPEGEKAGAQLLQRVLSQPLRCIAENSGAKPDDVVIRVAQSPKGIGFNARSGQFEDLLSSGVMDPVRVSYTALRNAASVASLILTTHTLIADKPESVDPTAGPAMGGGSEGLGRD
ncbi:MAG: molecular chaperone GroEL [Alphaproteobacteria bacterium]|nr:molecular chaperone GroEL [Alphaproteobacteria bacterium]